MISMNQTEEPTPAERDKAIRVVAGYALDADDQELLLDMLGLTPQEPEIVKPTLRKVPDSAAARCRSRYQAMDAFDPDTIRLRTRRGIRRAG